MRFGYLPAAQAPGAKAKGGALFYFILFFYFFEE
jgi:hypothetical protein